MAAFARIFPYALIALLVGSAFGATLFGSYVSQISLLFFAVILLLVGHVLKNMSALFLALLLVCFSFGAWRYAQWESEPLDSLIMEKIGTTSEVRGVVVDEPDVRETSTHLTLLVKQIDKDKTSDDIESRILVSVATYPEFHYGDEIIMRGKLDLPKKFTEADGQEFNYPMYLATKGIRYQMFFPHAEIVGQGKGNKITELLFAVKHRFTDALASALPEPQSALLSGLLLGGKRSLGAAWIETFRIAGIVHIVVLSGYNMTIVADWLMRIFRFTGFYGSIASGAVGIVLFALMTGGGATVVRAAVMALIALLARATGRTYTMLRALLLAAVVMVMDDPSILLYDPSFQLSFLASLGLIWVTPVIERRTTFLGKNKLMREVFVSTLATQTLVLPMLLFQTGTLSVVSLPANMFVLPVIPFTMISGFVAGLVALLSPALGVVVALPAYAALSYILSFAMLFAHIPYAAITVPLTLIEMFAVYAVVAFALIYEHKASLSNRRAEVRSAPPLNSADDRRET